MVILTKLPTKKLNKKGVKMKKIEKLLVISNHPPDKWSDDQKQGWDVIDYIPFPNITASLSKDAVIDLADDLICQIAQDFPEHTVTIQGEYSLTCSVISRLSNAGREPIFPTTERVVEEKDGVKTSTFKFVQWR